MSDPQRWQTSFAGAYRVAPHELRNRLRAIAGATVEEALSDLGRGEIGGNNRGRYVWSRAGRRTSGPWCAAAVYAWLLRACDSLGYVVPFERTHSARELGRRWAAVGRWLDDGEEPVRGDLVVWARAGTSTSRRLRGPGHVGIVTAVDGGGYRSVEGNVGGFPARVDVFAHPTAESRRVGFARLWQSG